MTQLAPRPTYVEAESSSSSAIAPSHAGLAMSFQDMRERVKALDQFYRDVMQEETDYGIIPGTPKPTLYQPGAQLLDAIFGLAPKFESLPSTIIDYEHGFFAYDIRCSLISKMTGEVVADAIGSCNSKEDKYRWRNAKPTCLQCGGELRRSKDKPEYYCWVKTGGCGATFSTGDERITPAGKVENDDPFSLVNTILKMAQKRAHVGATLNATGASRIFTQDVEDMPIDTQSAPAAPTAPESQPRRAESNSGPVYESRGGAVRDKVVQPEEGQQFIDPRTGEIFEAMTKEICETIFARERPNFALPTLAQKEQPARYYEQWFEVYTNLLARSLEAQADETIGLDQQ